MIKIGKPLDSTLLNSKWESLALAPVGDPEFPDDYFIFTAVSFSQIEFVCSSIINLSFYQVR